MIKEHIGTCQGSNLGGQSLLHGQALCGGVDKANFGVHAIIERHIGTCQRSHLGVHPIVSVQGAVAVVKVLLGWLGTQVIDAGCVAGDEAGEHSPDEPPGLPQRQQSGNDCGDQAPDDGQDDPEPAAGQMAEQRNTSFDTCINQIMYTPQNL